MERGSRAPALLVGLAAGLIVPSCSSDGGGSDTDAPPISDASSIDATIIDAALPDAIVFDAPPPPECPDGVVASFTDDVQPIFTANCATAGCHDNVETAAQLDLTAGTAYGSLVGVTALQCNRLRVSSGDIDNSYLVHKLTGRDMCSGAAMPKGEDPLSDEDLALILAWICDGAAAD